MSALALTDLLDAFDHHGYKWDEGKQAYFKKGKRTVEWLEIVQAFSAQNNYFNKLFTEVNEVP